MDPYQVYLLGEFRILRQDKPALSIVSARLQSLLAYLILHRDKPISRQQLSFLFWPDSDEKQARANLRGLLFRLNQVWPGLQDFMQVGETVLPLNRENSIWLDTAEFERSVKTGNQSISLGQKRQFFQNAVSLYRGDLFPNCYDDWIVPLREGLRRSFFTTLEELIEILETEGDLQSALDFAHRLQEFDPLYEPAYQYLIRLHVLNGNRAGAIQAFQKCKTILRRELDVEPSPAILELYARVTGPVGLDPGIESRRYPLIGRDAEWKELQKVWQRVKQGAHFLVLKGEAGIGKTTLAEEFTRWVHTQGGQVAITRCYAGEGNIAYGPVVGWLRNAMHGPTQKKLAPLWLREVSRLAPGILIEHPEIPAPEPLTAAWQRQKFYEALARVILPDTGKLLLIIDDLQWCDQETLEWLRFLMRFDQAKPILIVATFRVEEAFDSGLIESLLKHLADEGNLTEIDLTGLDKKSVLSLASTILNHPLDDIAGLNLYEETEGNPLFVVEISRAWLQGSKKLPRRILGVIETRLALLSSSTHELIEQAAILERDFSTRMLIETIGLAEEQVVQSLDELLKRRLILERGEDGFDFIHVKVRDVVYQAMSSARRQMLHRRAAEAIIKLLGQPGAGSAQILDTHAAQIAAHFEKAGSPYQALQYYARAADYAAKIFAHHGAEELYHRAINSALKINWSGPQLTSLYAARGRMLEHLGQFQRAVEVYTELERLASEREDLKMQCIALTRLAACYVEPSLVHSIDKAEDLLSKGLGIARAIGDHEQEAHLLWCRLMKATHYGDPAEAEEAGEVCIDVARENGLTDRLALALHDFSLNLRLNGKLEKGNAYAEEAGSLFRQQGNLNMLADHLNQQAVNYYNQMDFDQALSVSEEAAVLSLKLDNKWNQAYAYWIQAMTNDALGNRETAIHHYEDAIRIGTETGFLMSLTIIKLHLGHLLRKLVQVKHAIQLHTEALETGRNLAPFMLAQAEAQLAMDFLAVGNLTLGKEYLLSALGRPVLGSIGTGFCFPYLTMAQVEWACLSGEWSGVLEVVQAALDQARQMKLRYFELQLGYELARVYLNTGKVEQAKHTLIEMLDVVRGCPSRLLEQQIQSMMTQMTSW